MRGNRQWAEWFAREREQRKLGIRQVARYLDLSPNTVSDWERAGANPKPESIRRLALLWHMPEREVWKAAGIEEMGAETAVDALPVAPDMRAIALRVLALPKAQLLAMLAAVGEAADLASAIDDARASASPPQAHPDTSALPEGADGDC